MQAAYDLDHDLSEDKQAAANTAQIQEREGSPYDETSFSSLKKTEWKKVAVRNNFEDEQSKKAIMKNKLAEIQNQLDSVETC